MSSPETVLEIRDLSVDLEAGPPPIRAIADLSFEVRRGEILGIVGESGSGKTMTGLSILGLLPPPLRASSGRIAFQGTDLLGLSENELATIRGNSISMIFQEPMTALNPVMRIGRQIAEVMERHQQLSQAESWRRAGVLLRAVRIADAGRRLFQYPHELSGGMRQRAMIAMALACDPRLIIADEPTTALDVTVQAQIFDLIRDIRQRFGTSIVLITHNMGAVAELADRIVVMYAGRKVEEGIVRDVLDNPRHPYTSALLACALEVNSGADSGARQPLHELPGNVPLPQADRAGCSFAPRCTQAMDRCRLQTPPLFHAGKGHVFACWLSGSGKDA